MCGFSSIKDFNLHFVKAPFEDVLGYWRGFWWNAYREMYREEPTGQEIGFEFWNDSAEWCKHFSEHISHPDNEFVKRQPWYKKRPIDPDMLWGEMRIAQPNNNEAITVFEYAYDGATDPFMHNVWASCGLQKPIYSFRAREYADTDEYGDGRGSLWATIRVVENKTPSLKSHVVREVGIDFAENAFKRKFSQKAKPLKFEMAENYRKKRLLDRLSPELVYETMQNFGVDPTKLIDQRQVERAVLISGLPVGDRLVAEKKWIDRSREIANKAYTDFGVEPFFPVQFNV